MGLYGSTDSPDAGPTCGASFFLDLRNLRVFVNRLKTVTIADLPTVQAAP